MKRLSILISLVAVLFAGVSCDKESFMESDFSFDVKMNAVYPKGSQVTALITLGQGSPVNNGYQMKAVLDGKQINITSTSFDDKGQMVLDLTEFVGTVIGEHSLTVSLKYNSWKNVSVKFVLGQDITEINGVLSAYSLVCNETLQISPAFAPKEVTDTLKCEVYQYSGDFIKIDKTPEGWSIYTENRLPSTAIIRLFTHKLSKSFTVTFSIIAATELSGVAAAYNVPASDDLVLRPVLLPETCMEPLQHRIDVLSGDDVTVEKNNEGVYRIYAKNREQSVAKLTFYTESFSRTIDIRFFYPVKDIIGLSDRYDVICDKTLVLDPKVTPEGSMEPLDCALLGGYDPAKFIISKTGNNTFAISSKDGMPGVCEVKVSSHDVSRTVKVYFYYDLDISVDVSHRHPYDIRLSHKKLPSGWPEPVLTFGAECSEPQMLFLKYVGETSEHSIVKANIPITEDAIVTLPDEDQNGRMYTYCNELYNSFASVCSDLWEAPNYYRYYLQKSINYVVFVTEKVGIYHVNPVAGTANVAAESYYPGVWADLEGKAYKFKDNVLSFVGMSRADALKQHTLEYYYNEATATGHLMKF